MCVSIIIPSCRPRGYIYKCLDSLTPQITTDMEVIVIINGEKEPYYSEVKNYLHFLGTNFKLLYTPKASASHARNVGINAVTKDYIFFLDDDDCLSSEFLHHLLELKDPEKIIVGNSISFDQDGHCYENYINRLFKKDTISLIQSRGFYSNVVGKLIPKKLIASDRFNENIVIGEDSLFMTRLSVRAQYINKSVPNQYYCVRLRADIRKWHSRSWLWLARNGSRTILQYLGMLCDPKYNKLFIVSRIFATVRNLMCSRYTPLEKTDVDINIFNKDAVKVSIS